MAGHDRDLLTNGNFIRKELKTKGTRGQNKARYVFLETQARTTSYSKLTKCKQNSLQQSQQDYLHPQTQNNQT